MSKKKKSPHSRAYRISNMADGGGDVPEIFIFDDIGSWGIWADDLVRELKELDAPRIRVRLSSAGGDAFEGITIFNALRKTSAYIDMEIDGQAGSAASVVAMAGDTITMSLGSMMMIHEARVSVNGDAARLRHAANVLQQLNHAIASIYVSRTGRSEADVLAMMAEEQWMTAEAAVAAGFADGVDESRTATDVPTPTAMAEAQNREQLQFLARVTSCGITMMEDETMNKAELLALLKESHGLDVEVLQSKMSSTIQQLSSLRIAAGERTPQQLKNDLAQLEDMRNTVVDRIVSHRRMLGLTGDSDDDVAACKRIYTPMDFTLLNAEAASLTLAVQKDSQFINKNDDGNGNGHRRHRKTGGN